jgi:Trk-type K+ transport system membrane component
MIPDWMAIGMIFLVVIGVVWEVGVVIILFGGIGFAVYYACFRKKEYQLVKESNNPAAVQIDGKNA